MTFDTERQLQQAQDEIEGLRRLLNEYRLARNTAEDQLVEAQGLLNEWAERYGKATPRMVEAGARILSEVEGVVGPSVAEELASEVYVAMWEARNKKEAADANP